MPLIEGPLKDNVVCTFAFTCPLRNRLPGPSRRIGVGEKATLTVTGAPPGARWSIRSGGGKLETSGANDQTATFTAPDIAVVNKTSFVILELGERAKAPAARVVFSVVRPSQGKLVLEHGQASVSRPFPRPSAEFKARIYLLPEDVSFKAVEFQEQGGTWRASRAITYHTDHPTQVGNWAQPSDTNEIGTKYSEDTVRSAADAWDRVDDPAHGKFSDGAGTLPIEWAYRLRGAGGDGQVFTHVEHSCAVNSAGDFVLSKGGVEVVTRKGAIEYSSLGTQGRIPTP